MTEYVYRGRVSAVYPSFPHPERPGVLSAEPGEIVDFGNESPPGDGNWYDVPSEEQPYHAGQAQEQAE